MPKQTTGIIKLPSGKFLARYFDGFDAKGRRLYPSKVFADQSQAVQWRAEQVSAKHPGREAHNLTLGLYLDQWLAMRSANKKIRGNSLRTYRQSIDLYIKPELGRVRLSRLSAHHVEQWQAALLANLSPATVATARALLSGALRKAVVLGLIRSNPVAGTEAPGRHSPEMQFLTPEQALTFLAACDGAKHGLLFKLALQVGLRPEETRGLCWRDLELGARGVVHVRRVVHELPAGKWMWEKPKSESGTRSIVFPGELARELQERRKQQLEDKLRAGQRWQNLDLVFCDVAGQPLRRRSLVMWFKIVLRRAELPEAIRLYDLRHSFVVLSILAGVDLKTLSQEAGHKSVAFTLDRYGHVIKEMHETAADKRAELLRKRADAQ
ncbi:MAG TPA: site-specific integrase [Pyrinomonadaceae bacterium]|nr:site-specific integrase [Pyrinomonadaceae bacterium]